MLRIRPCVTHIQNIGEAGLLVTSELEAQIDWCCVFIQCFTTSGHVSPSFCCGIPPPRLSVTITFYIKTIDHTATEGREAGASNRLLPLLFWSGLLIW